MTTKLEKRHFELIAGIISKPDSSIVPDYIFCEIVVTFSRELKRTNPNFNERAFDIACYKERPNTCAF